VVEASKALAFFQTRGLYDAKMLLAIFCSCIPLRLRARTHTNTCAYCDSVANRHAPSQRNGNLNCDSNRFCDRNSPTHSNRHAHRNTQVNGDGDDYADAHAGGGGEK
jgi:hypothetical protein